MIVWRDPRSGMVVRRPLVRRTALRVRSKRLAARERIYSQRRKVYLTEHPVCAVRGEPATEVHHKAGRGLLLLDESTWLAVCHSCHGEITRNPAWALANGYSMPRVGRRRYAETPEERAAEQATDQGDDTDPALDDFLPSAP